MKEREICVGGDVDSVDVWQMGCTMDQISIKTPNPKCRLFFKIDQ